MPQIVDSGWHAYEKTKASVVSLLWHLYWASVIILHRSRQLAHGKEYGREGITCQSGKLSSLRKDLILGVMSEENAKDRGNWLWETAALWLLQRSGWDAVYILLFCFFSGFTFSSCLSTFISKEHCIFTFNNCYIWFLDLFASSKTLEPLDTPAASVCCGGRWEPCESSEKFLRSVQSLLCHWQRETAS